jgi:hypothetical protein
MTRLANGFLKATQIACALYRFNTLRIASRVFSNVSADVLSRDFCGRTLYVDIKRGNPQRLLYLARGRALYSRASSSKAGRHNGARELVAQISGRNWTMREKIWLALRGAYESFAAFQISS